MVTVRGSGLLEPSRAYLEYHMEDFSGWLQRRMNQSYTMAIDFFNSRLTPIEKISPDDVNDETNVFQLIQAHQEKAARPSPVEEIRTVFDQSTRGMLSTFSESSLADHTKVLS
ncbi:hypothetical protein F3Y22_tig00000738pilonHSYRG00104 [Hibiscus syriacus]|uniref:Uncharacterized protein n=1 Tax=Hibiscus syriacus TaxID=106335 RepID=A0A6A3D5S7_HIBSY|nr:hypothetical protein F3Y22_tig00000738pilonHSYRG00104 [Hibiscus syriacus]